MARRLQVSGDNLGESKSNADIPSYWKKENHVSGEGGPNEYLRAENWVKDVQHLMLSSSHRTVALTQDEGTSILRYQVRDEPLSFVQYLHNSSILLE